MFLLCLSLKLVLSVPLSRLGKTIQTVVRIVDNRPSTEDRKAGWGKATLYEAHNLMLYDLINIPYSVVCPVALIEQWSQEIKKFTGSKFTVVQHYGPSRSTGTKPRS